jgi:hypothetical protein
VPANCSACGDKCASTSTSVTSVNCTGQPNGSGATCQYTCATGYLDCDQSTNPPDLNGCECHSPGATQSQCCTGSCPIQHNNGLNQGTSLYYDCSTYASSPSQVAHDACTAYAGGSPTQCSVYGCLGLDGGPNGDQMWCSDGNLQTDCICWTYTGPDQGHLFDSHQLCPGFCPSPTDPTYN